MLSSVSVSARKFGASLFHQDLAGRIGDLKPRRIVKIAGFTTSFVRNLHRIGKIGHWRKRNPSAAHSFGVFQVSQETNGKSHEQALHIRR